MAVTKLSLYNDALILLGQRVLASDTEDRPNRHTLDALYDNGAVDYCLEIIKPRFAAKLEILTGVAPTLVTAYSNEATLPADFLSLVGVFADAAMDQPITRFTHEEDKILSDFPTIYVRYVRDFSTVGLTNMTVAFGRVVSAYLAREMSVKVDPEEQEQLDTQLSARIEISMSNDTDTEADNKGLTDAGVGALDAQWFRIYNDALQLLGQPRLATVTDDNLRKNQLDITRASCVVEAMLEDQNWSFGTKSVKIFFDPSAEPDFGPPRAARKPTDMHRIDGVWADEYRQYPIKDYIDEGEFLFTDYQIIYVQYISTDYLDDPTLWPTYFKRFVAAQMAVDAGPSIPNSDVNNAIMHYERRGNEARSTDAMASPPTEFTQGNWVRSRTNRYPTANRNRP